MTTVSGSLTTATVSSSLRLGNIAEDIAYTLTGPADAQMQLERAVNPALNAWEPVVVLLRGKATVSGNIRVKPNDTFRVRALTMPTSPMVTNGTFASATGWTVAGAWSIGSGVATRTASAADVNMSTTISAGLVAGATYRLGFTMTTSAGTMTVDLGGGTASAALSEANGAVSVDLVAGSSNAVLRFIAGASYAGTIDGVTLTPLATYSFNDGDAIIVEHRDANGVVYETVKQSGTILPRDLTVEGALAVTGAQTVTGGLTVTGDITGPIETTQINDGPLAGFRNALINGAMTVAQRGTSFTSTGSANNDDTYNLDRWTLLSDGNDIVDVTQNTSVVPTGGLHSMALDVKTANKKFGIIQFIEQKNCIGLIGNTVTLSFKARKGGSNATVATMRAAILAWSGTADTVTSDVVSAWGASGTNPTLVANWTAENTAADLTLTDSFQTFQVSGAVDTASAKNIGVFLYYNNADGTVADFIYITDVQLEIGARATPFERRPYSAELSLCLRYYTETNHATSAWSLSATDIAVSQTWLTQMRVAPTLALLDTTIAWNDFNVGDTSSASTLVSSQSVTVAGAILRINGFAGHTQNIPGDFATGQTANVFSANSEL